MTKEPEKILRLIFGTAGGKTSELTLPNPRRDLTPAEIEDVMDLIIKNDVFTTPSGSLTKKVKYEFIN